VNDDDEQMKTNIHVLSGIRTHGLSIQVIKAYASYHVATGTSHDHDGCGGVGGGGGGDDNVNDDTY
jgi:hypothetical protein